MRLSNCPSASSKQSREPPTLPTQRGPPKEASALSYQQDAEAHRSVHLQHPLSPGRRSPPYRFKRRRHLKLLPLPPRRDPMSSAWVLH